MKRLFILVTAFILFNGCIEPIVIPTDTYTRYLTIEGGITTEQKAHAIKLSFSARYTSKTFDSESMPVTSAAVAIRDESGQVEILAHNDEIPGQYLTSPDFFAVIGKQYTLHVITTDGVEYQSLPETVAQVPQIENIELKFVTKPTTNPLVQDSGLEVYVTFQDEAGTKNYYQFLNSGLYELNTRPDLYVVPSGETRGTPAPKDCCKKCWRSETPSPGIHTTSDANSDGNRQTQLAFFVEDDGLRFMQRNLLHIQMMSLTKNYHDYLRLLKQQLQIKGSIFDPPPATITGNMIAISPEAAPMIGFFFAADVTTESMMINRTDFDFIRPIRTINNDCREVSNTTTTRPPFW